MTSRFLLSTMMIGLVVVGTIATASGPAAAEDSHVRPARAEQTDVSWYEYDEQAEYRPNARAIVMQRAMLRAEQRQNRMAAMKWYGMSNSRPTAAATPFCSVYSPVWQSPGGRPFAWSASQRPIYVINNQ